MLSFYGSTHPGRVESSNEDCIGWDLDHRVWLVADGMGGHARGEVASAITRDTVLGDLGSDADLRQAVMASHEAIQNDSSGREEPMGSTVVAIRIHDGVCDVVWVGDSRVYLWRKNRLRRVSTDHSFLEALIAKGKLTEEQARNHPDRNLVTQTLGMGEPVPDEERVKLKKKDWLLLCSDGLTDELSDDAIAEYLGRDIEPKEAVELLLNAALDNGGRDNISVVIVEPDEAARNGLLTARIVLWGGVVCFLIVALTAWWLQ